MTSLILVVIQLSLGLVFVTAGLSKLTSWADFADGLTQYFALSSSKRKVLGSVVIAAEIVIGALHLSGLAFPITAFAGVLVVAALGAAAHIARRGGQPVSCLCFGAGGAETVGPKTFVRLGLMMSAELILAIAFYAQFTDVPRMESLYSYGLLLGSAVLTLLIIRCILRIGDLVALRHHCA